MFKFEATNDIYLLANSLALGNEGAVIEKALEIVERELKSDRNNDSFTSLGKERYFRPVHLDTLKSFQKLFASLGDGYQRGLFSENMRKSYHETLFQLHDFLEILTTISEIATKQTWCALAMRGDIAEDPEAVAEKLAEYYADKAMLDLEVDLTREQILDRKIEIEANINKVRNQVFSGIVVSGLWSEGMKKKYAELLLSPNIDKSTKLLILSAVTIACIHLFDYEKYAFLVDMYLHAGDDSTFKIRAVVGVLFATKNVPGLYINKVRQLLKDAMAQDGKLMALLMKVAKVEFHARNIDEGENVFQKQFSRIMFKRMKSALSEADEDESIDSYENEDDDEEEEECIKEVMDVMGQGTDVYYSQFKKMKNKAFFHSMYNWFMPFSSESEVYMKMQKKVGENLSPVVGFFFQKSTLCDSDRYSFAYMVLDPKTNLARMFEEIKKNVTMIEMDGEIISNGDFIMDNGDDLHALINYMQCLSRFFDLAPMSGEFDSPFAETEEYSYEPPMAFPVFDDPFFDKERIKLARYFFRHDGGDLVPAVMPKNMPDTDECHFIMGYSLYDYDETNIKYTVKALPHVEWLMKHSGDNVTFLELAAHVYESLCLYDKMEDCWKKVLEVADDEELKVIAKRDLAIHYSAAKRYDEAIKVLYELYYQDPTISAYVVMLARNLLLQKPGDMAAVDKALDLMTHFVESNDSQSLKDILNMNFGEGEDEEPKSLKSMFSSFLDSMQDYMQVDHAMDYALNFYMALCQWVKNGKFDDKLQMQMTDFYMDHCTDEYDRDHVYYCKMVADDMREWLKSFGKTDADIAIVEEIMRVAHNQFLESAKQLVDGLSDKMNKNKDNGKLE